MPTIARRPPRTDHAALLELLDQGERAEGERHLATLARAEAPEAERAEARAWLDRVTARVLERLEARPAKR